MHSIDKTPTHLLPPSRGRPASFSIPYRSPYGNGATKALGVKKPADVGSSLSLPDDPDLGAPSDNQAYSAPSARIHRLRATASSVSVKQIFYQIAKQSTQHLPRLDLAGLIPRK